MLQINLNRFTQHFFFFFAYVETCDQNNSYCKTIDTGLKGIRLFFCKKKIM
jgi:hypothetical protein